ncbi:MAG: ORF6N domain-containing protein [Elusimicrobia bacterium]|nr:ORF6N domain-containing protein [Elusimicrobiota bacterium]
MKDIVPAEIIENKIFLIREHRVMIDFDLAQLYGVPTKVLNQAVKRNKKRFPPDFMFKLSNVEMKNWRSQNVTSNPSFKKGLRWASTAFTEKGVAMLSSVLNSERAIEANIQIMRTFTKIREMLINHKELKDKIEILENKYDAQFKIVFDAIRELMAPPEKPKKRIGFSAKEKRAKYRAVV